MPADLSDTTLIVTAWRRPGYLRQALESWAAVPEAKALRRFIVALAPSPQEAQMRRVIRSAGIGIAAEIRTDSPACAAVPGEHRALGEAITEAFSDGGCGFVIASSEDVVVSDDALRYFAWAREQKAGDSSLGPLVVCAHNETGQGWHDPKADDSDADQSAARFAKAFNPWCWALSRPAWEKVIRPEWDWDCTSGTDPMQHGWDWQVMRLVHRNGLAITPEASRARNIGQHGGVYAHPGMFGQTQAKSFRAVRGDVEYRLEAS